MHECIIEMLLLKFRVLFHINKEIDSGMEQLLGQYEIRPIRNWIHWFAI